MHSRWQPNLQHAIERVERPGGSHEGVGRKKWRVLFVSPSIVLCVFLVLFGCFRLARFLLAASPPCPLGWSLGAFWSNQFSADPFSGYLVVSALTVSRGVPDHPRANTSVQERKAPEQHPQYGVEGRAPHRAEAFVAMRKSEDRSLAVTTLYTTRHDNRAVARYLAPSPFCCCWPPLTFSLLVPVH